MSDSKLVKVGQEVEYLQKPEDYDNYHNGIQDSLDCSLHGDVAVD
jgi:hypothetical protein